jgi:hypothetical protein
MSNLLQDVKDQLRCYCSHNRDLHFPKACVVGDDWICCDCSEFEPLPADHFDRCPDDRCNSNYFYQDEKDEFLFHCHNCESSFKFDGFECFNDLRFEAYKKPLEAELVGRKLATTVGKDNFVWIPAGSHKGQETGLVGYWDGTLKKDSGGIVRAEVEIMGEDGFHYVLANLSHLYIATDADIDAELEADEISSWREYLVEREKQPLESAAAVDFNSSAASKDGGFLERLG